MRVSRANLAAGTCVGACVGAGRFIRHSGRRRLRSSVVDLLRAHGITPGIDLSLRTRNSRKRDSGRGKCSDQQFGMHFSLLDFVECISNDLRQNMFLTARPAALSARPSVHRSKLNVVAVDELLRPYDRIAVVVAYEGARAIYMPVVAYRKRAVVAHRGWASPPGRRKPLAHMGCRFGLAGAAQEKLSCECPPGPPFQPLL
jgi:hypothetical protein